MIYDPIRADDPPHESGGTSGSAEGDASSKRGFAVVFVLIIGILVVLFNVGSEHTKSAPGTSSPAVLTTNPASAPAPGATPGTTSDAVTTSQGAASATTNPATPQTPVPPGVITIVAAINKVADNGDLVVNDGNADYTVVMSPSPKLVNLNGKKVGKELIQVGLSIQITGLLTGTSLSPQTIVIPVR